MNVDEALTPSMELATTTAENSVEDLECKKNYTRKESLDSEETSDLPVEDIYPESGRQAYLAVFGGFLSIGATFGLRYRFPSCLA